MSEEAHIAAGEGEGLCNDVFVLWTVCTGRFSEPVLRCCPLIIQLPSSDFSFLLTNVSGYLSDRGAEINKGISGEGQMTACVWM